MLYVNDVADSQSVSDTLLSSLGSKIYQYWMQSSVDRTDYRAMYPGLKSFAKLYTGDFDGDGAGDLIVWRKMYKSNAMGSNTKGFKLRSELFGHYEYKDGGYKLQTTQTKTIERWLDEAQLTWQLGYPNRNECLNKKGQAISELRDVLLNDPEVMFTPQK